MRTLPALTLSTLPLIGACDLIFPPPDPRDPTIVILAQRNGSLVSPDSDDDGSADVALGRVGYDEPSPTGVFQLENTGPDTLYISVSQPAGAAGDLINIAWLPHTQLAPGQRKLLTVDIPARPWAWTSGDWTAEFQLEVRYFFSGQDEAQPETPSTTEPPEPVAAIYNFLVQFTIDCDVDLDGFDATECAGDDCDDSLDAVHPGAVETCTTDDENCDGAPDHGAIDVLTWYWDKDGDSFGNPESALQACSRPSGSYVDKARDCDDNNSAVSPSAEELCDGVDNNCRNGADEGDVCSG